MWTSPGEWDIMLGNRFGNGQCKPRAVKACWGSAPLRVRRGKSWGTTCSSSMLHSFPADRKCLRDNVLMMRFSAGMLRLLEQMVFHKEGLTGVNAFVCICVRIWGGSDSFFYDWVNTAQSYWHFCCKLQRPGGYQRYCFISVIAIRILNIAFCFLK